MKHLTPLFLITLMLACTPEEVTPPAVGPVVLTLSGPTEPLDGRDPLTKDQINRIVLQNLLEKNRFSWSMVNAYTLWSATMATDSILSVGYRPEGYTDIDKRIHEVDVESSNWAAVREALIAYALEQGRRYDPELSEQDILPFGRKPLPYIALKVYDYETVASLRSFTVTRYADAMGYGTEDPARSGKGCDSPPATLSSADYTTVAPDAKVSWNYSYHNIEQAWDQSTGDNIVIGLIDTGLGPNQDKLNQNYSSGWSTDRWREKYGFFATGWWWWKSIDGPDDDCGHGTAMGGTIAAPRTDDGTTVGVAYESNLVSCRGTDDVVINESNEKDGVSDSFIFLGDYDDVKIISMSLGDVFSSGQVEDAVNYAYNQGKLIFCAAGTSLDWTSWWGVIFPANLPNTVAVTGVKNGSNMERCSVCHDGPQVDFVVVMEDVATGRTPLTLYIDNSAIGRTGGSSVATATTAGIAGLVWAKNPSQDRATVLQRLKEAGHFYPGKSNSFGWGKIDALEAVQSVN